MYSPRPVTSGGAGGEKATLENFSHTLEKCVGNSTKTIGQSSKNLGLSQKTLRPSWCPKQVTGLISPQTLKPGYGPLKDSHFLRQNKITSSNFLVHMYIL